MTETAAWQKFNDADFEAGCGVLLESGSMLMTFVIHSDDATVIIGVPVFDDQVRQVLPTVLRLLCIAHRAVALSHVTEGWMLIVDRRDGESEAEMEQRATQTSPTASPDRIEILIATTQWREPDGTMRTASRRGRIMRNADDAPVAVVERECDTDADASMDGPWFGLLPAAPPNAADRVTAQMMLGRLEITLGLQLRKFSTSVQPTLH